MSHLQFITISGFKSIGSQQQIFFGDVTVLLGANGAGKSNLISFFNLLNSMEGTSLQTFVASNGMANAILHFGSARTKNIKFEIHIKSDVYSASYKADLTFFFSDSLFIHSEALQAQKIGESASIGLVSDTATPEALLLGNISRQNENQTELSKIIGQFLSKLRVFQFHDTSKTSRLRASSYIEDTDCLLSDAGNLPAFLYAMKNNYPKYYRRIVQHIQTMIPQFRDFRLTPSQNNPNRIFLNWIGERGDDYLFGPHQLSDGSLRYISLATLLLQPKATMPDVIVLDEPELGLHPAAITSLAEMIALAKQNCQIVLATQSSSLANLFSVDDIVIVEYNKRDNESTYRRLDKMALNDWLKDYSIEELWEKNVLGGRP